MTDEDLPGLARPDAAGAAAFHWHGAMATDDLVSIGRALERSLEARAVARPLQRRLYAAFIELAQNARHYGARTPGAPGPYVTVAAVQGAGQWWICCANDVDREGAERVAARIEWIRSLSRAELREACQRKLDDEGHGAQDVVSRGAGLGLLTLARHATDSLAYALVPRAGGDGAPLTLYVGAQI